MMSKVLITIFCFVSFLNALAIQPTNNDKYENSIKSEITSTDSLMHKLFSDSISTPKIPTINNKSIVKNTEDKTILKTEDAKITDIKIPTINSKPVLEDPNNKSIHKPEEAKIADIKTPAIDTINTYIIPVKLKQFQVDTLLFLANSFFIELVYKGLPFDFNWNIKPDFKSLFYGRKATTLSDCLLRPVSNQSAEQTVADLRQYAREQILRRDANLYVLTFDQLSDPEVYSNHKIEGRPYKNIRFMTEDQGYRRRRLIVRREQMGPWQHKVTALAQFSQNYISPNWYQGGNSNLAILGIVTGQLNYDNKKGVQWENSAEWHMGFNSVSGDSLRKLSTNDDVFKMNSKLGVKAGGNWFYSGSVDLSTEFFNSYNGINSPVMVTSFLTPVRLNVGVGLDYKYKKIFSIMFSPVTYKYIYVKDSKNVDPNLFGISTGKRVLSEIGSSFNSTLCLPISREIQLDSKLSFYTNYQTVEIDWELVCNMVINRFMSTRISFNPRYDNSVIFAQGDYAKIQLKQLLSVGFSHRFY